MTKCCIKWCNARKNRNLPELTLHRLPTNETMRKKWLDIIGMKNINTNLQKRFVCSQHFEVTSFNRTLDVIRLREGAVPSSSLVVRDPTSAQVAANQSPDSPSPDSPVDPLQDTTLDQLPILDKDQDDIVKPLPMPSTSLVQNQRAKIDALKKTCAEQRKLIKCLNERVRRRDKKIAVLTDTVKDLKTTKLLNNEEAFLLVIDRASPEDSKKKQITNSRLPIRKKYSEEIRKLTSLV